MSNISDIPVNKHDLQKKKSDISEISEIQMQLIMRKESLPSFDNS